MSSEPIEMIEIVAEGLAPYLEELVFLGGAAAVFYMNSPAALSPRPTEDVDCIVEFVTYPQFARWEERLRSRGFTHDARSGAPLCRWEYRGVTIDVMPIGEEVLGFSNRWYDIGMRTSEFYRLPSGREIRILSLECFLATKLEAYLNRGNGDPRTSSDIEDVLLGGANARPPEDCGGTRGFEEFKSAISDPTHPEHESYLEWCGMEFDPLRFDLGFRVSG